MCTCWTVRRASFNRSRADAIRMSSFTESVVEDAALAWLQGLGYAVLHGPDIAAGEPGAERSDPNYRDVVLDGRLRRARASVSGPGP